MDKKIDQAIQEITNQIIANYQPQYIFLFGSAAKGRWRNDTSDLDFLIIKDNVPRRGIDRVFELENKIKRTIACDFIIYRPEELEQRKRMGDPFVKSILQEAKILYARS